MPVAPARLRIALALVALLGCRERQGESPAQAPTVAAPVRIVRPSAPGSFVDLVAKMEPSVVHLRSSDEVAGGPAAIIPSAGASGLSAVKQALGTGFVLDSEGHIVTNHHVLGNTVEVTVVFANGEKHAAKIIGRDPKLDIAVLKIPPVPSLRPVRIGKSDLLRRGEWLLALGNPFGTEVTASAGIISSLGHLSHEAFVQPTELNYLGFIQVDARIDATNSGGPIVNTSGEVVAISTASEALGSTVGYAIPISRAAAIIPQLKKNGVVARSYVGMYVDQVTTKDAQDVGLEKPMGALITDIVPGGPGDLAGLRVGDVILTVGGKSVTHASLPWAVSTTVVGSKLRLGIWRSRAASEVVLVTSELK